MIIKLRIFHNYNFGINQICKKLKESEESCFKIWIKFTNSKLIHLVMQISILYIKIKIILDLFMIFFHKLKIYIIANKILYFSTKLLKIKLKIVEFN